MEKIENFCYSCGAPLNAQKRIWAYDGQTGEPLVTYDYSCVNKRWYMLESHPLTSTDAYVLGA